MSAKDLRVQIRPRKLRVPSRSDLVVGVGILLVGMLRVGEGWTLGAMVQIWTILYKQIGMKHTYLYVKYSALSDLPAPGLYEPSS